MIDLSCLDDPILNFVYQRQKHEPLHFMDEIEVRIRNDDQPYGTGTTVKFKSDELDGLDPEHISALDRVAMFIGLIIR